MRESREEFMDLSTHQDRQPRADLWSIARIIIVSALLTAWIEPHFSTSSSAAPTHSAPAGGEIQGGAHAIATSAAIKDPAQTAAARSR
jgi:hypothetical protein